MSEITISVEEYRELTVKAWRLDRLRELGEKSSYNTEAEKILLGLGEEEDHVDG